MRRFAKGLAAFTLAAATVAAPCHAASLSLVPTDRSGFWAGTRVVLSAQRASSGRLRVHVGGTIAVKSSGRIYVNLSACAAGLDDISSYGWTPELHPVGRQAVPDWPVTGGFGEKGHELRLRGGSKTRVSFDDTVSYGYPAPRWTDCVTLDLWRVSSGRGGGFASAFDRSTIGTANPQANVWPEANIDNTMFVTVALKDGRHVECGPAPAFCSLQRPHDFIPPALPDFPPSAPYPGSPGHPTTPDHYAYHVACTTPTADLGTCTLLPGS